MVAAGEKANGPLFSIIMTIDLCLFSMTCCIAIHFFVLPPPHMTDSPCDLFERAL